MSGGDWAMVAFVALIVAPIVVYLWAMVIATCVLLYKIWRESF